MSVRGEKELSLHNLLTRAMRGEGQAYRDIVDVYERLFQRIVGRTFLTKSDLGLDLDSIDVALAVQNAYGNLWQYGTCSVKGKYHGETEQEAYVWLRTIITRSALSYVRKRVSIDRNLRELDKRARSDPSNIPSTSERSGERGPIAREKLQELFEILSDSEERYIKAVDELCKDIENTEKIKQIDVAKKMGVSEQRVSRILQGLRRKAKRIFPEIRFKKED